jgi:hypothetical protein
LQTVNSIILTLNSKTKPIKMQKKNNFIDFVCDFIDFVCKFTVKIIEHTVASYITLTVVINKQKNELYKQYRMD